MRVPRVLFGSVHFWQLLFFVQCFLFSVKVSYNGSTTMQYYAVLDRRRVKKNKTYVCLSVWRTERNNNNNNNAKLRIELLLLLLTITTVTYNAQNIILLI